MHAFVTGFPSLLSKLLADCIARSAPDCTLSLLVPADSLSEAQRWCQRLKGVSAKPISGEVPDMHLGLSGDEYRELRESVTDIFHLATVFSPGLPRSLTRRIHLDGTRNVLELARERGDHLTRLNYLSTARVAGDRIGVIAEDELDCGQGFHNEYEETAYEAERIVAAESSELPVTIYRPSSIVGDSRTGEVDRFDGPFYLGLYWLLSPLAATVPLPGDGQAPMNVVPADFVAHAVWTISQQPRAAGRTVHVVDPQPISARRVFELVAGQLGRRPQRFSFSARAAEMMLKLPFIEKWARPQRTAISYLDQLAFYRCAELLSLLKGTGVECPPLPIYVDKLTRFFQESQRKESAPLPPLEDPLDPVTQNKIS